MKHSYGAAIVAMVVGASTVFAGGTGLTRTASRTASWGPVQRGGGSCGCESRGIPSCGCDSPVRVSCGCDSRPRAVCGCDSRVPIAPRCGTGCNACSLCRPMIIPNLIKSIDCALTNLFCSPCNIPTCRPRTSRSIGCGTAWRGYSPSCGCQSGGMENWSPTNSQESNPFVDDELRLPPPVPKDARVRRGNPQLRQVHHHRMTQASKPSESAPVVVIEVEKAEPKLLAVEPVRADRSVRQVEHVTVAKRSAPKNPLREE